MMQIKKRSLTMLIVISIALIIGIGINFLWSFIDRQNYPQKFKDEVSLYSEKYDVPEYVIYAVIRIESKFDPEAVSRSGALGLMQMLPPTFEWLTGDEHLAEHLEFSALKDPNVSIRYGTYYLKYLYDKFQKWDIVFAAYNWGEGNVTRLLADGEYTDEDGNITYIPAPQPRAYVPKVKNAMEYYKKLYYNDKEN